MNSLKEEFTILEEERKSLKEKKSNLDWGIIDFNDHLAMTELFINMSKEYHRTKEEINEIVLIRTSAKELQNVPSFSHIHTFLLRLYYSRMNKLPELRHHKRCLIYDIHELYKRVPPHIKGIMDLLSSSIMGVNVKFTYR